MRKKSKDEIIPGDATIETKHGQVQWNLTNKHIPPFFHMIRYLEVDRKKLKVVKCGWNQSRGTIWYHHAQLRPKSERTVRNINPCQFAPPVFGLE